MRLKGLVWFFAIALLLISLWELSYTWVVRSYENKVQAQATREVNKSSTVLSAEQRELLIEAKTQQMLDSTKDKSIYPIVGTTYQKCKENELNLGLDLQGGISVTMDVSLEGLLKSLSNNSRDPQLIKALQTANAQKGIKDADYITLFSDAYTQQNGSGKLSSLFAGPGKEIKINDSDKDVISKIRNTANGAIKQTYKILVKRIDKFGVAQPNINLDENKGVINVELAGIKDPVRVRKFLQSSANLQFWEVYRIDELAPSLKIADDNLHNYLNGVTAIDSSGIKDSTKAKANANPFFRVINPIDVQTDPKTGKQYFASALGSVALQDTGKFFSYLNNDVVRTALPADVKFLFGVEEKAAKGNLRYLPLYAIKTLPGSEKAPLEGEAVEEARQDFDERGNPAIKMQMTSIGTKAWARLTTKNVGRPIAIALDDVVYSAPNVNSPIEGGNSEISGSFTIEEAQDLSNILKAGKLDEIGRAHV